MQPWADHISAARTSHPADVEGVEGESQGDNPKTGAMTWR